MSSHVIHPSTNRQLEAFRARPAQAVVLVGPTGSGKFTLAGSLAEAVLGLVPGGLAGHGYVSVIRPEQGKAIGIEAVRSLDHFLSLKVPGPPAAYDRSVIIEDSQLLTLEAQNALLKILEEPPAGTLIILTANHERALLPTIRSRLQAVTVQPPDKAELRSYFSGQGFEPAAIDKSYAISGGLTGLMSALLREADHPLLQATEEARQLLSRPVYERLTMVDQLAKQKELAADTLTILQQMARVSLLTASGPAAKRWQAVLRASYRASEALANNGQPKLVMTNLALQF
ncbi:MAG TPA: hypothetical protein VM535_00285 [Candidatus Saccharimonadales bacterium]|nr:hypothetical protein [Candidatus Saccharimonadales bacterium]